MVIIGNLGTAHLRIARPTDDLHAVTRFYQDGLGFEVIGQFRDHQGFDGVMPGHGPVVSINPYWEKLGRRYADPDGYRVALQGSSWPVK